MSVPGAEAPSEIMLYFPGMKAFCVAEEINRSPAQPADLTRGEGPERPIMEQIYRPGDHGVRRSGRGILSTHHWPTWGNKNIVAYWEKQRDLYRYLHDQTLHLANQGYTPREIAEMIKLPSSIANEFANLWILWNR